MRSLMGKACWEALPLTATPASPAPMQGKCTFPDHVGTEWAGADTT